MKANAPEKIYIHPDIGGREFIRPWLRKRANQESVEYVRTDAFIEKACEWLDNRGCLYIQYSEGGTSFNNKQFIEDFKKYTKGE